MIVVSRHMSLNAKSKADYANEMIGLDNQDR